MRGKRFTVAWFFVLYACNLALAEGPENSLSLEGFHKFAFGDNPVWSSPEYEDSHWRFVQVPGSWQSQGLRSDEAVGWYRIYFIPPDKLKDRQLVVSLGVIGNADEVFLNGVKIGGEGAVGAQFVESPWIQRVYRVPQGLLKFRESNLLAVRVMNTRSEGGIIEGKVLIGDSWDLLVRKLTREASKRVMEVWFFALLSLAFLGCVFLYDREAKKKQYIHVGVFLLTLTMLYGLESLVVYQGGLKTHLVQRFIFALLTFLPANLLIFLISIYREPFYPFLKFLVSFSIFLAFGFLIGPPGSVFSLLTWLWALLVFFSGGAGLFLSVRAYLRKAHESGPILLGVGGLFLGLSIEAVHALGLGGGKTVYLFYVRDYEVAFFMTSLVYAHFARFTRIQDSIKFLSTRVLRAYEEERKRLSREIHDGVGQSLLAIKLNFQMKEAKARIQKGVSFIERESFKQLISEISHSIEELRYIAMDLRPSFLKDADLAEAFERYGKKFQERSGIQVKIHAEGSMEAPLPVKDHLYRIYQEALSNVAKHAGATTVEVTLQARRNTLFLKIADDGRGFEAPSMLKSEGGLGLSTIKERVELLGGMFRIVSSRGKGTAIHIEIPLED